MPCKLRAIISQQHPAGTDGTPYTRRHTAGGSSCPLACGAVSSALFPAPTPTCKRGSGGTSRTAEPRTSSSTGTPRCLLNCVRVLLTQKQHKTKRIRRERDAVDVSTEAAPSRSTSSRTNSANGQLRRPGNFSGVS